jgi:hypothetical protein
LQRLPSLPKGGNEGEFMQLKLVFLGVEIHLKKKIFHFRPTRRFNAGKTGEKIGNRIIPPANKLAGLKQLSSIINIFFVLV